MSECCAVGREAAVVTFSEIIIILSDLNQRNAAELHCVMTYCVFFMDIIFDYVVLKVLLFLISAGH